MPELPELFYAHWAESQPDIPLEVDWLKYISREASGILHVMTARDAGKLVGYFTMYVQANINHSGTLMAASNSFFLTPEYRKGTGEGLKFIRAAKKMARDLGAERLYIVTKAGSQASKVLAAMKNTLLEEETYSCLL